MCTFIAIAVAGYRGDVRQPFKERHLAADELTGAFAAKLPAGTHLSITDGHCACSVFPRRPASATHDPEDERRRYQRKGWSQAKIERAIESRRGPTRGHRAGRIWRKASWRQSRICQPAARA